MHPIDLSDSASSYSRGDPGSRQCSCCPRRGRRHWGCCECTSACGRCEDPVSAGSEEAQRADVAGGEAEGGHADKAEEVRTVQYSVVVDQIRSDVQTHLSIHLSIHSSYYPTTVVVSHIADYWIAWRRRGTMQEEEETRSRTTLGSPSLPSPRHREPLLTGNPSSSIHPSIID